MQFKRINLKKLKLGSDAKVPASHIRSVEKDSKLAYLAQKSSEATTLKAAPESVQQPEKDFLATALDNCQKFNEDFEGPFDKG